MLDPLSLGLVLMVLGMGGTLLTLFLLSLLVDLMKLLFPVEAPKPTPPDAASSPTS